MAYNGCIRIEKIANGWELEFSPPEKESKPGGPVAYTAPMKYAFDDKAKLLATVGNLVDELKSKSAEGEYSKAFKEAVEEDD
jgi:hypothetical protein